MRLRILLLSLAALAIATLAAPSLDTAPIDQPIFTRSDSCGLATFSSRIATPILKEAKCNKFINQNGELTQYNIRAGCTCFFYKQADCRNKQWVGWKGPNKGTTWHKDIKAYYCRNSGPGDGDASAALDGETKSLNPETSEPPVQADVKAIPPPEDRAVDTIESRTPTKAQICMTAYYTPNGVDTIPADYTCHAASVGASLHHVKYGPHCYCTLYRTRNCKDELLLVGTGGDKRGDRDIGGRASAAQGYKCRSG